MGVRAGSQVLIAGSGGNGMAFVAHAVNCGAAHVAMLGHPDREGIARAVGASEYYDYKQTDLPRRISSDNPDGFDFIIDAVGKRGQIDNLLKLLKPGGTVGIYGLDDFEGLAINPMCSRGTFTYYNGGYDEAETHDQVVAYIRQGKLDARHWLNLAQPFPLSKINDAFESLHQKRTLKALIQLSAAP